MYSSQNPQAHSFSVFTLNVSSLLLHYTDIYCCTDFNFAISSIYIYLIANLLRDDLTACSLKKTLQAPLSCCICTNRLHFLALDSFI